MHLDLESESAQDKLTRLIEVQLKIIITDAALHIRSRKIQKRHRIGLSACLEQPN